MSRNSKELKLRILTFNTWHALNGHQPKVLFPIQNPINIYKRYQAQKAALKSMLSAWSKEDENSIAIICLQELNPLYPRILELAKALNLSVHGDLANTGIRLGFIGYPFFLNEGIGTFFTNSLKAQRHETIELSGKLYQKPLIWKILNSYAQFSERRIAIRSRFIYEGLKIVLYNLHLHNGPEENESGKRRVAEMNKLLPKLKVDQDKNDLIIMTGDFNCSAGSPVMEMLDKVGFRTNLIKANTWNPDKNELCKPSYEKVKESISYNWERKPKQLDHILYLTSDRTKISEANYEVCFNETPLSDHYGLSLKLVLKYK